MKGNVFFKNPYFCAVGILKLVRKSSPSHQRVTVHRNSPERRCQFVKKKTTRSKFVRQTLICVEIVSWILTSHGTTK